MPKGIVGISKGDAALNKIIKFMERSGETPVEIPLSNIEQIRRDFPDDWRNILSEMVLEMQNPEYLADKKAAEKTAAAEYNALPRWRRDSTESEYVFKTIDKWRSAYLAEKGIKMPVIRLT